MTLVFRLTTLLLLALCCAGQTVFAADSIPEGEAKVEAAARKAGAAGKANEEWAREKQELLDDARQLIFEIESDRFALSRQNAYIKREQSDIRELKERLAAAEDTRRNLEPVLEALYAELAQAVSAGLPFAEDEHRARLVQVRRTLDNPDALLGDKFGVLLEALIAEARYGLTMEAEDAVMTIDNGPMSVTLLRVGRLALLRVPTSGEWVDRFDPSVQGWVRLEGVSSHDIIKAIQITREQRSAEVVELPVGTLPQLLAPEEVRR